MADIDFEKGHEMNGSDIIGSLGIEYDPFLRSPLWREQTGTTLSVLSALARLNIDPWKEAASLALLPKDDASARLSSLIADLPEAQTVGTERYALCERSVSMLPTSTVVGNNSARPGSDIDEKLTMPPPIILHILGGMVVFGIVGASISAQVSPAKAPAGSAVTQSASGSASRSTAVGNK